MNENDIALTGAVVGATANIDESERLKAGEQFAQGAYEKEMEFTEEQLKQDEAYANSFKIVNKFLGNEDTEGTTEELSTQGMQLASDFKNALYTADEGLGIVGTYNKFKDAPPEVKQAAWYLWDKYDKADITFSSLGRAVKSMGKDPSTYTGVAAGFKFFGGQVAKSIARKRFEAMLMSGTMSGGFTAGEELTKQEVQGLEEKDWEQVQLMGSMGAIVGTILPVGVEATVAGVKQTGKAISNVIQEGEELMAQQAGGGAMPSKAYFNSVLENALTQTSQKNWSTSQLKGYLAKQGVKTEEMQWSGIEKYLEGKDKVSTQELLENINQPTLEKTTLGEYNIYKSEDGIDDMRNEIDEMIGRDGDMGDENYQEMIEEWYNNPTDDMTRKNLEDAIEDNLGYRYDLEDIERNLIDKQDDTKYRDYSTKGAGENYREELTTLGIQDKEEKALNNLYDEIANNGYNRSHPKYQEYLDLQQKIAEKNSGKRIVKADGKHGEKWLVVREDNTVQNDFYTRQAAINSIYLTSQDSNSYHSSHWDEANVLYHVRKQDTKIDGDNTLLIEEIQSDLHQEGRKKGYKGLKPTDAQVKEWFGLDDNLSQSDMDLYKDEMMDSLEFKRGVVPQAPYSKTWHEKAMKDQIAEAVEKDYDRVAWVAGKEQAERYSLSTQIDELKFRKRSDGKYKVTPIDKNGKPIYGDAVEEKDLESNFGKEMAIKIISEATDTEQSYKGLDLEVGGEGMKGFYDKMLPKWTNKYIKKYGSSVEIKELPNGQEVWSFKITDKMKKEITEKGQPLYQVGGATTVGGIAATQQEDN